MHTIKEEMKRNKDDKHGKPPVLAIPPQVEELSPRKQQFTRTYQLAFDASIMVRDQILIDKKKEDAEDARDMETFTMLFKDLFAKYFGEFRYKGDQKVIYCVLKS